MKNAQKLVTCSMKILEAVVELMVATTAPSLKPVSTQPVETYVTPVMTQNTKAGITVKLAMTDIPASSASSTTPV